MAYELRGRGKHLFMSFPSWMAALRLARHCGWRRAGTRKPRWQSPISPDPEEWRNWNGSYFFNEGQLVEDDDATAFAAALKRALPLIPEQDQLPGDPSVSMQEQNWQTTTAPPGQGRRAVCVRLDLPLTDPRVWFSGTGRQVVEELIDLCEQGEFEIW